MATAKAVEEKAEKKTDTKKAAKKPAAKKVVPPTPKQPKKDPIKAPKAKYHYGVGRRKRSIARAKYFPGSNPVSIVVDGKPVDEYFSEFYRNTLDTMLANVSVSTGDIFLFIRGGGINGQVEAARLAIAKALIAMDEGYRPVLRANEYLTTDNRKVLPKRPGLRKARKAEQWSKR